MLLAQRIKIAREEKGLLQKQLASALDIDVPMYCRIERGDRQAKREQVIQLSRIFNIEQAVSYTHLTLPTTERV